MDKKLPIKIKIPDSFLNKEIRYEYVISSEMKAVWAVELDLLTELLRVCNKYNIQIYADSGTLLGAIRHDGFIPWDDDIDMVMLRKDYNRLCDVAEKEFNGRYFFQTEYSDPGSFRGHAQLRNSDTTAILKTEYKYKFKFNQGIFIDIFPIDNLPDDLNVREEFLKTVNLQKEKVRKVVSLGARYNQKDSYIKMLIKMILHIFNKQDKEIKYFSDLEKLEQKYLNVECCNVGKLFFPKMYILKREWFGKTINHKFEMIEIPISCNYEKILAAYYGDWKIPRKQSTAHGDIIFDTKKVYTQYI